MEWLLYCHRHRTDVPDVLQVLGLDGAAAV